MSVNFQEKQPRNVFENEIAPLFQENQLMRKNEEEILNEEEGPIKNKEEAISNEKPTIELFKSIFENDSD